MALYCIIIGFYKKYIDWGEILTNTGIYVFVYYFLNFWAFEFEMRF